MKFSDEYTYEDLIFINHATFFTSMLMLILATIAKFMGVI